MHEVSVWPPLPTTQKSIQRVIGYANRFISQSEASLTQKRSEHSLFQGVWRQNGLIRIVHMNQTFLERHPNRRRKV
jgi:hypothetical protein